MIIQAPTVVPVEDLKRLDSIYQGLTDMDTQMGSLLAKLYVLDMQSQNAAGWSAPLREHAATNVKAGRYIADIEQLGVKLREQVAIVSKERDTIQLTIRHQQSVAEGIPLRHAAEAVQKQLQERQERLNLASENKQLRSEVDRLKQALHTEVQAHQPIVKLTTDCLIKLTTAVDLLRKHGETAAASAVDSMYLEALTVFGNESSRLRNFCGKPVRLSLQQLPMPVFAPNAQQEALRPALRKQPTRLSKRLSQLTIQPLEPVHLAARKKLKTGQKTVQFADMIVEEEEEEVVQMSTLSPFGRKRNAHKQMVVSSPALSRVKPHSQLAYPIVATPERSTQLTPSKYDSPSGAIRNNSARRRARVTNPAPPMNTRRTTVEPSNLSLLNRSVLGNTSSMNLRRSMLPTSTAPLSLGIKAPAVRPKRVSAIPAPPTTDLRSRRTTVSSALSTGLKRPAINEKSLKPVWR
jgi:hypothetical protein